MKALPLLITSIIISFSYAKAQIASAEWKQYTYADLNLSFELPADFVFEYPGESLGFIGSNSLGKFSMLVVKELIPGRDERRNRMFTLSGLTYNPDAEQDIRYGTTNNGYEMIGTVFESDDNLGVIVMFLTDVKYRNLNYYITLTYGEEGGGNNPAYLQAQRIINGISPIEK